MKLKNVLIVVDDIERSRKFHSELFGLGVVENSEGHVILTEGLVLQNRAIWEKAIEGQTIWENNATELYFEENDIDEYVQKLENYDMKIKYISRLMELPWGKKVIRFYDPDGNLIEVGTRV